MILTELTVSGLRCIEHAELEIPPGLASGYVDHGSGKTGPLEAIFLLGRCRSFRMRNSERLIQRGQDHLRVIGRVGGPSEPIQALGFEVTRDGTLARIGGGPAQSLADTGSPGLLCVEPADAREVGSDVICVRGAGCAS